MMANDVKWLQETHPEVDFGSDPQGAVLAHILKSAVFLPEEEIITKKPDPARALEYFDAKSGFADRYLKLSGLVYDYITAYGPMDPRKLGPNGSMALEALGRMRAYATRPGSGMERVRELDAAVSYMNAGRDIVTSTYKSGLRSNMRVDAAIKARDGYAALAAGERALADGPVVCTVFSGVGKNAPKGSFHTKDGAAAFLQSCVYAERDNVDVTDGKTPAAKYPGIRQLGIAALGHGDYFVDCRPDFGVSAWDMYKATVFGDYVPGGAAHGEWSMPVESRDEFMFRCNTGDMLQSQNPEFHKVITMGELPGNKDGSFRKLCDSMKAWSVRDVGSMTVTELVGRSFRQSSMEGLNFRNRSSGAMAGLPTLHDLQNPDGYLDSLVSRAGQAAALSRDIGLLDKVLENSGVDRSKDGPGFGDLDLPEPELRSMGMIPAGTLAHQSNLTFGRTTALDHAMLPRNMVRDLESRYTMAMYGEDVHSLDGMTDGARERDGIDMKFVRDSVWNGRTAELDKFQASASAIAMAEMTARKAHVVNGTKMPFEVRMETSSGEKTFHIATEAFLNRYVADTAARLRYHERFCEATNVIGFKRDKLFLKAPDKFDMSNVRDILNVARGIKDGEYRGRALSPFDGAAIEAAAADVLQPQAEKTHTDRKRDLDRAMSRIERPEAGPEGPCLGD